MAKTKNTKSMSRSKRANLVFPVGRVTRYMRKANLAPSISANAGVFTAAVMEYIIAEIVELSGNTVRDRKKQRITPRDIYLSIHRDDELAKYLGNVIIASGGVVPGIQAALLPAKKIKAMAEATEDGEQQPNKKSASKKKKKAKATSSE